MPVFSPFILYQRSLDDNFKAYINQGNTTCLEKMNSRRCSWKLYCCTNFNVELKRELLPKGSIFQLFLRIIHHEYSKD